MLLEIRGDCYEEKNYFIIGNNVIMRMYFRGWCQRQRKTINCFSLALAPSPKIHTHNDIITNNEIIFFFITIPPNFQ